MYPNGQDDPNNQRSNKWSSTVVYFLQLLNYLKYKYIPTGSLNVFDSDNASNTKLRNN